MNDGRVETRARTVDWDALKDKTRVGLVHEPTAGELEAVFSERAVALSRKVAFGSPESSRRTFFAFGHGAMTFAVELETVLRVLGKRRVSRIPGAPRHLDRVFYEGGRIAPGVAAPIPPGDGAQPPARSSAAG